MSVKLNDGLRSAAITNKLASSELFEGELWQQMDSAAGTSARPRLRSGLRPRAMQCESSSPEETPNYAPAANPMMPNIVLVSACGSGVVSMIA